MVLAHDLKRSLDHEHNTICRDDAYLEADNFGTEPDHETMCSDDEGDSMWVGGDVNLNVPEAQAAQIADQLTGNARQAQQQPTGPATLPQPADPEKSFLEKWWLPLLAAGALTWFIARDFIRPEQVKQGIGLRPMEFGLIDDDGQPAPFITQDEDE